MAQLISRNPATGETVGEVPVTPVADIPAIVARARAAQPAWGSLSPRERMERLLPMGEAILARADELAELLTREMGKPLAEARGEVLECTGDDLHHELDDMAAALQAEVLEDQRTRTVIYRDPYGVCAAITPWNFPFAMPHWMVAPALMAGNAVVFKPSEETPLIGEAYARILIDLLPPGVLQIVHGADEQGKALVASEVDLIAFTGSREAGKHILKAAAKDLKRVILELGGKDPLIVLSDADIAQAAKFAAVNSFRNAGQVCVSTERIYVDQTIADQFMERMIAETKKLTVGNGLDAATRIGPMVNERQRDHVRAQVDDALSRGAKIVHGGLEPEGNFLHPTIVEDVTPDMSLVRDETFGPVACVVRVKSEDEAVALANNTPFGLGAAVYGEPEHAAQVARRLTAGMVGVNRPVGGVAGSPWVGARESGYGFHHSHDGHRQFAQTRVVSSRKS
jgi:acyl-CoA reductase-like NAD-dependent aldehyde dehydrogenase